jgi:nucleoside-diphosphate-sugar epimerase
MSRQRALVTGGAGFLGSHLCDALLAEDGLQLPQIVTLHISIEVREQ